MSSPKAAAAKRPAKRAPAAASKAATKPAPRAAAKPPRRAEATAAPSAPKIAPPQAVAPHAGGDVALSAEAERLAAEIERALAEGRADKLSGEALQALTAAVCRTYAAQVEQGADTLPLKPRGTVTSTDIMLMASALLRSANLAVFELGMWQSWTGR
jgi:histone H3/H4